MTVKEIKFMTVYRMAELDGKAYFAALKTMIDYFEWSNGRPGDDLYEVIDWVKKEDILFHANGDMIGGDE